jgi:hypothetical protein
MNYCTGSEHAIWFYQTGVSTHHLLHLKRAFYLVLPDRGFNPSSTALEASMLFGFTRQGLQPIMCKEGAQREGLMLDSGEELYKWFTQQVYICLLETNCISDVIVSMLTSSAVDHGLKPLTGASTHELLHWK